MFKKNNENVNSQSTKVIQLGLNISLKGDPDNDFEIVLDDEEKKNASSVVAEPKDIGGTQRHYIEGKELKKEIKWKKKSEPLMMPVDLVKERLKTTIAEVDEKWIPSSSQENLNLNKNSESSDSKELTLIHDIQNTMKHFENFSDHLKEIPRLRIYPMASNTPFSCNESSKSESNLLHSEKPPQRFICLNNFNCRKKFVKDKPLSSDIFLRPLPGADLCRRTSFKHYEPLMTYGSVDSLIKSNDCRPGFSVQPMFPDRKYESDCNPLEVPSVIVRKSENDSGEKSTSSADATKDIKIYQNGGVLIMQNFKDSFDPAEKKEVSNLNAKIIENYSRLQEEINCNFLQINEQVAITNSSVESQSSGKMVQFDLPESNTQINKMCSLATSATSNELSPIKPETEDLSRRDSLDHSLDNAISTDFLSMSTQENDSILSNQPGTSPSASGKKLEWDSGADVGYLNLDLSKENLSTIERIVLRGLSSDGLCEKNVIYENIGEEGHLSSSKVILERKPSEIILEEIVKIKDIIDANEKNQNNNINFRRNEKVYKRSQKKEKKEDDCKERKKRPKTDRYIKGVKASRPSVPRELESLKINIHKICDNEEDSKTKDIERFKAEDKSVNVNTLFSDREVKNVFSIRESEEQLKVPMNFKSSRQSPKSGKKLKKKLETRRQRSPRMKDNVAPRTDKSTKKDVISSNEDAKKNLEEKIETKVELGNIEQNKDTEEIIVNESLNRESKIIDGNEPVESMESVNQKTLNKNQHTIKRPISADSVKTVLLNSKTEQSESPKPLTESLLIHQLVQTNKYEVESIGIQAFSSQKSSISNTSSSRHTELETSKISFKNSYNMSSKNVQSFGLNYSLPKELTHVKDTVIQDSQNTKSTQFFGGPVNSLPNYHAQLSVKPVESCARMFKVLKSKKNLAAGFPNLNDANKRIMRDEIPKKIVESIKNTITPENKENFLTINDIDPTEQGNNFKKNKKTNHAKKTGKNTKEGNEEFQFNGAKKGANSTSSALQSAYYTMLTSEYLKERGDSVDRNLIQQKYFQSQLTELEKKEKVSKNTSMDLPFDIHESNYPLNKNNANVACQYSLRSLEEGSGEGYGYQNRKTQCSRKTKDTKWYDSSQNLVGEELGDTSKDTNRDFGTGDSFPSSTQTANSWVPGLRNSHNTGVGKTWSFEYLPGHIYESNGNLKEKLPNENEISGSFSASSAVIVSARSERSHGEESSEGRKTLVLENSLEDSWNSGQLKNLDDNSTQLNIVVTRLREKDAEIRKITRSVLVNFWRHNGSGDCSKKLAADGPDLKVKGKDGSHVKEQRNKTKKLAAIEITEDLTEGQEKSRRNEEIKDPEISIGCQTENQSSYSSLEKDYEKRKALESRLTADKESQIKWIEKEIYHLNILRGILEKRRILSNRKKKYPNLTLTSDKSHSSGIDDLKDSEFHVHCEQVTPAYGCTISLVENNSPEKMSLSSEKKGESERDENVGYTTTEENSKYGMAVSLNGDLRKVLLLPVGVQVSLNNAKFSHDCSNDAVSVQKKLFHPCMIQSSQSEAVGISSEPCQQNHSDMATQCPSAEKSANTHPSISIQTNIPSPQGCGSCNQKHCVCLNLSPSEKSERSSQPYSRNNDPLSGRKENSKQYSSDSRFTNCFSNEKSASHSTSAGTSNIETFSKGDRKCGKTTALSQKSTPISTKEKNSLCKCENCPKRKMSTDVTTHHNLSNQSNREKTAEDNFNSSCLCFKNHIGKFPLGTCHVIKIVGPSCCDSEKNNCSCKKKTSIKMENQCCQTDDVIVESKDVIINPDSVKLGKRAEMINTTELKTAKERRQSVDEKYLFSPKVSCEKKQAQDHKYIVEEKNGFEKHMPEHKEYYTETKTLVPTDDCVCQKKEKEKPKGDNHPRHYFLRIEETEMDECSESPERRKSLEVITVMVPVKKAGKAKIYGNNVRQINATKESQTMSSSSQWKDDCVRCRNCLGQTYKKSYLNFPTTKMKDWEKLAAEKPDSYRKKDTNNQRSVEMDFPSVSKFCTEEFRFDNGYDKSCSSQESCGNFQEENSYSTKREESEYSVKKYHLRNEIKGFSRNETPRDYNSHKDYRPRSLRDFGNEMNSLKLETSMPRYNCPERTGEAAETASFKHQKRCPEADQYDSDYYNYNKKEFMTKSELLKEENKNKKKVHQPCLQEYLETNRPDFCNSAENRRRIISERAKERIKNHDNRMECVMNLMHQCNNKTEELKKTEGPKRIFTTPQMREQTMKRYRQLPEVTSKVADQKRKEEYRTNKLMADIFAKKLQLETLKGHINLSNSVSLLNTI